MVYQLQQKQLHDFSLVDDRVFKLRENLSLCGRFATKNFYCKKLEHSGDRLIKSTRSKFYCEVRYCDHSDCLVQRFARQVETFNDIQRFWNLDKLMHFVIGFEPIPELEFKENFSYYNKRFQYVLNKYFEKLRKKGVKIEGIRVLDFSFKTFGIVYLHFHFGVIPPKNLRYTLKIMQVVRKTMIKNMRNKTPFHLETFFSKNGGHPSKDGVLSYLAIRSSGMYKYDNTDDFVYDPSSSKLIESINSKKYIFLRDVLTEDQYLKSFYNKPFFVTIGGLPRPLPHGSNITDGIPKICPCCGHIDRNDVRVEIIFDSNIKKIDLPPDILNGRPEIEYIKII